VHNEPRDLQDRTKRFALQVIRTFSTIPKTTPAQVVAKQLVRSGTSVGANYREAYWGRSKAEFIAKCGDSLRELEETAYWLELLVEGKSSLQNTRSYPAGMCRVDCYFRNILRRSKDTS